LQFIPEYCSSKFSDVKVNDEYFISKYNEKYDIGKAKLNLINVQFRPLYRPGLLISNTGY